MLYLHVTDSGLTPALVAEAALPGETLTVLVTDRNLARRLRRRGYQVRQGRLEKASTWRSLGVSPDQVELLVVVSLEKESEALQVVRQVRSISSELPVVLLNAGHADEVEDSRAAKELAQETADAANVERVRLADVVRAPFQEQFTNAFVRRRVQQYREHFKDADRILILMHDEPDPDAIAAGLGLRALLRRKKQTTVLGTFQPPTRPENLRMLELLGIEIVAVTVEDLASFDRVAVVDTQPHIFGGKVPHADLVIDHHPLRTGYTATFKDIRTAHGSTTSLVLDYLLRTGMEVSKRIATAAVYAIKTDTWKLRRGTNAKDVEIFAQVFPVADQSILRRIEGETFTLERLRLIGQVAQNFQMIDHFLYTHLGQVPRDDFVPTMADLLLEPAESHWSAVSGVLDDNLILSIRNLGYQRSAGELVQQVYGELGSAGGHRQAAKAIIPLAVARERFGDPEDEGFARRLFEPYWTAAGIRS